MTVIFDILRTPEGGGFLRTRTTPRWSLSVGLPVLWQVPTFILTWRIRRFVDYDDSGYRQVETWWCGFVLPQGHALTPFYVLHPEIRDVFFVVMNVLY